MNFNLKLKHKILSIAFINIIFFIVSGYVYYNMLTQQKKLTDDIVTTHKALYYFQNGDMMHNALRGDVLGMTIIKNEDADGKKLLLNEYQQHATAFTANINDFEKLAISDDIKKELANVKPSVVSYINYCFSIINLKFNYDSVKTATENELNTDILKYMMFKDSASIKLVTKKTNDLNNLNAVTDKRMATLLETKMKDFNFIFNSVANANQKVSDLILVETKQTQDKFNNSSKNNLNFVFIGLIVFIICSVLISYYIADKIQKPIMSSKSFIDQLANGNLPPLNKINNNDEIGEMRQSLNKLTESLTIVKNFAKEVGDGKFDSDVTVFEGKGDLGVSLDGMRLSLKTVAEDDFKRNWSNVGIAKMGEILRNSNLSNTEAFYNNIIGFIVKYLNANQGGLFILNDEYESDQHLELASCFAYDKKKFLEKRIEICEGLVGQCFVEKEYILMTDVPDKYTQITSGLGEKTAACIILVPLKINDEINGVIEVAAFTTLEDYKVEFLNKLSENISSSIQNYKTSVKTTRLLSQTQQQSEEMKSQEEEMRQNLEEMQATQEEFYRKEMAYKEEIDRLKG